MKKKIIKLAVSSFLLVSITPLAFADSSASYGAHAGYNQPSSSSANYGGNAGNQPSNSSANYGGNTGSSSSANYGNQTGSSSSANYGGRVRLPTVTVTPGPSYQHVSRDNVTWVRGGYGRFPQNAVVGGHQPNRPHTLFVCHADFQGGVHPGKFLAGKCNISWGGREIAMSNYELLISRTPLFWMQANYGNIPGNAVAGGYEGPRTLYICQADFNGGVHPGKVVDRKCNFGWGGREISVPNYRILVQ